MNTGNNEKKYWTIKEVSDFTGLRQSKLRFWEKKFPQLKPLKTKFGHRVYTQKDIDIILEIKKLYEKKREENVKKKDNKKVDYKKIKKALNEILEILRKNKRDL